MSLPDQYINSCRACFNPILTDNYNSLYLTTIGQTKLCDLFTDISTIHIDQHDELPQIVCDQCQTVLVLANEFRTKCLNSDRRFREVLDLEVEETKPTVEAWTIVAEGSSCANDTYLEVLFDDVFKIENVEANGDTDAKNGNSVICKRTNEVKLKQQKRKGELLACEKCNKSYKSQNGLNYHNKTAHNGFENPFECETNLSKNSDEISQEDQAKQNPVLQVNIPYLMVDAAIEESVAENNESWRTVDNEVKQKRVTFTCEKCNKPYGSRNGLNYHIKAVHNILEKPRECDTVTSEVNVPNLEKTWICERCNHAYKSRKGLIYHFKNAPYRCMNLTYRSAKRGPYSQRKRPRCDYCYQSFKTRALLVDHFRLVHNFTLHQRIRILNCADCETMFNTLSALSAHILDKHSSIITSDKKYKCIYCPAEFIKYHHRVRHINKHKRIQFKCVYCAETFGFRRDFYSHMVANHDGSRNVACLYCDEKFPSNNAVHDHNRVQHSDKMPFLCQQCGKCFATYVSLFAHVKLHGGNKKVACQKCPKTFSSNGALTNHMFSHTKVRTFECDVCGKKFRDKYQTALHMYTHTGKRPLRSSCKICNKRFRSDHSMNTHLRTHSGEKPFKCAYCPKAYKQSADWNKHLRVHVGENTYRCNECPKRFRLLRELTQHKSEHYVESMAVDS